MARVLEQVGQVVAVASLAEPGSLIDHARTNLMNLMGRYPVRHQHRALCPVFCLSLVLHAYAQI